MIDKVLTIFLWLNVIGAGVSVFLYLFVASGTAKFWGGVPTATSDGWVRTVGSGDALVSFLAFCAVRTFGGSKKNNRLWNSIIFFVTRRSISLRFSQYAYLHGTLCVVNDRNFGDTGTFVVFCV